MCNISRSPCKVLGTHLHIAGSLVYSKCIRRDFTWSPSTLSARSIRCRFALILPESFDISLVACFLPNSCLIISKSKLWLLASHPIGRRLANLTDKHEHIFPPYINVSLTASFFPPTHHHHCLFSFSKNAIWNRSSPQLALQSSHSPWLSRRSPNFRWTNPTWCTLPYLPISFPIFNLIW